MKMVEIELCVFVDDIVLIADNRKDLENNLRAWNKVATSYGLEINTEKSKIMMISNMDEDVICKLNNEELEQVNKYKYLGNIISPYGTLNEELNKRLKITGRLYYTLSDKFLNHREISKEIKMTVYRTIYAPTLIYGCEN